jgi:hypothetical protein
MNYLLLADLVMLVHMGWIVFILLGLPMAWWRLWLAWPHLFGLLLILVLNLGSWYCPLTYLENWLRALHDPGVSQPVSFLSSILEPIIYPRVAEFWLRAAGMAWAGLNLVGYLWLLARRRKARTPRP